MKIPSSVDIIEKYVSALVVEESETGKMRVMKHREGLRTLESVDILSLEKIDASEIDPDNPMKYHGKRLLVVI